MFTINDYIKALYDLQAMGQALINQAEDKEECPEWLDELECMDMHLGCAIGILKKAT